MQDTTKIKLLPIVTHGSTASTLCSFIYLYTFICMCTWYVYGYLQVSRFAAGCGRDDFKSVNRISMGVNVAAFVTTALYWLSVGKPL